MAGKIRRGNKRRFIGVHVPEELADKIEQSASKDGRSLSNYLRRILAELHKSEAAG